MPKDIPPIRREAIQGIREYLEEAHEGQKRKTRRLLDGEPHDYITHADEVRRRSHYLLEYIPLPQDEYELLHYHPEIFAIIAECHDLIEDFLLDKCEHECLRFKECTHMCADIIGVVRNKLLELGVHEYLADTIMNGLAYLTKNPFIKDKKERERDMYEGLRHAPFYIKLIKLADEWHNLSTLAGKSFEKSFTNYVKLRKSWEIIFTEEELELLALHGFLEAPEIMRQRTKVFDWINDCLQGKSQPGDERYEECQGLYEQCIEGMRPWININPMYINQSTAHKVSHMCAQNLGNYAQGRLVQAGEAQVEASFRNRIGILGTLDQYTLLGFESVKKTIELFLPKDIAIAEGRSNCLEPDDGVMSRCMLFLDTVGLTGQEFLDTIKNDDDFEGKVVVVVERMIEQEEKFSENRAYLTQFLQNIKLGTYREFRKKHMRGDGSFAFT